MMTKDDMVMHSKLRVDPEIQELTRKAPSHTVFPGSQWERESCQDLPVQTLHGKKSDYITTTTKCDTIQMQSSCIQNS